MASKQKPSLADKLKSLGVKTGTVDIPVSKKKTGTSIQDVISGEFVSTRRGETYIHEEIYDADYRHGWASLETDAPLTLMATWAKDARLLEMPLEAFAFLDTETSGMAGGTGTYAFLVGAGRFEKTASGQRIFNEDDLNWVNCIRRLIKQKGLNIEGIRRMLALMPCWHLRPCTADNFQSCSFALGGVKPCWMMKAQLPSSCKKAECRYCNVYRGASKCENMKKLLYQISLEQGSIQH